MVEGVKLSTQELRDTAVKIRTIEGNLDEKLHKINEQMNQLEESWDSEGGREIRANMNALKPRFEEYKSVVESYAKHLDATAEGFDATELGIKRNASQFRS